MLVTTDDGYRLDLDPVAVDAVAFAGEVRARHRALAPLWSQLSTGPDAAWPAGRRWPPTSRRSRQSLRAWTGTAYADLGDHPDVLADRAALEELRATAQEDTALALLALGEHAAVLAATEQAAGRHPLRERTRSLQALALVRTGRQVEALEVLRGYRELLADELGPRPRAGGACPRGGGAAPVAGPGLPGCGPRAVLRRTVPVPRHRPLARRPAPGTCPATTWDDGRPRGRAGRGRRTCSVAARGGHARGRARGR